MGTISYTNLEKLADQIRPIVQPIIDRNQHLDPSDILVALRSIGSNVGSERSLAIIMERICST